MHLIVSQFPSYVDTFGNIEDAVVSKLEYGSSIVVVAKELGLSQSCIQGIKLEQLQSLHCPLEGRSKVLISRQKMMCV